MTHNDILLNQDFRSIIVVDGPVEFGELFDSEQNMKEVCRLVNEKDEKLDLNPKVFTQTESDTFSMTWNFLLLEERLKTAESLCFSLKCETKRSLRS